jgi:hypothetical protein
MAMEFLLDYGLLALVVFLINTVPAFMPPTWTILLFFYLKFDLSFLPSVVVGATFATLGRIVLYFLSLNFFGPFLSKESRKNLEALGSYFNTNTPSSRSLRIKSTSLLVYLR